ncbi:hypothetical protein [Sphaerisporangium flaviroseum]|uniref:hypothetical protein n=1 Tax=Sphaerisporangium flaviroseum TaxID=509199 RepID=UPI0031E7FECE
MLVLLAVAAVAVLLCVVMVSQGRGGELTEFAPDVPPLDLPDPGQLTAVDFMALQLPVSLVGYHTQSVDETLQRAATALGERDTHIAVLEQRVAELLAGRLQARQESYARPSWAPGATAGAEAGPEASTGGWGAVEHSFGFGGDDRGAVSHENLFDPITPSPGVRQVPRVDPAPSTSSGGVASTPPDLSTSSGVASAPPDLSTSSGVASAPPDVPASGLGNLPAAPGDDREPVKAQDKDPDPPETPKKDPDPFEASGEEPGPFEKPRSSPGKHSASNGGGVATGDRSDAEDAR